MDLMNLINKRVVVVPPGTPVETAARLMRDEHVGALVVLDSEAADARPTGVLTDRDLVIEVLAQGAPAALLTVGDIALARLVTLGCDEGLFQAMELMSREGVRRLVIVDASGGLLGLVSMDDILVALSQSLALMALTITREIRNERGEGGHERTA
ncbi:MAG: CBS domain-containing protein [Aquabacterium sp.]|jgi:signal-transduction protein with cAMP-binding, CBS, and nucleotidyltransferase domain|nr:MAG: CBS domain-containing protein [Aquabacterium sp.]